MNIYTISFLLILAFNVVKNKKSLHMLQQNLYNENNRYWKWIIKNLKDVFFTLDFFAFLILWLGYSLDNFLSPIFIMIALVFYFLEIIRILNIRKIEKVKKPLVYTKRVKRLIFTTTCLMVLPVIVYLLDHDNGFLLLLMESFLTYFS